MAHLEHFDHGGGAPWIIDQWCRKLSEVITSMTQAPALAANDGVAEEVPEGSYYYEIPLGADAGSLIIAAPEPVWMAIGGAALQAVGLDEADAADTRNTYVEILAQATSNLALDLTRILGREITSLSGRDSADHDALHFHVASLTLGTAETVRVFLAPSAALISAVEQAAQPSGHTGQSKPEVQDQPAASSRGVSLPGQGPESHGKPDPVASSKTFDLLLEVELPVSVSFGKTELMLRDVLKLTSGSIVEMSRTTNEPVDVIVNNCVIARGEVVVVDGNYGVRISKISSLRDRLRVVR